MLKEANRLSFNFFQDSYTFRRNGYMGEDRMSLKQFLVMGTIFILIIIVSLILKKEKRERLYFIYKFLAIFMPISEIVKISYSTYFDLLNGEPFNWGGILPFYTCSMLLYFLPFVAWGKGKMKTYSMAFFTTIGLVAGLSNFVYLSAAGWYPIFSYGCMYSIIYHSAIVFVGMSLMITGEYTPTLKSIFDAMVPVVIFSAFVIPINFIIKGTTGQYTDYMMLLDFNGFGKISEFARMLYDKGLGIIFSLLMLFIGYPIATALITLIDISVIKLINRIQQPKETKKSVYSNR
ncbi:MAG: YwaF family protein [Gammaproteobacteria bacterium]|nr:YwaF family protein [Gammaproteobacteria bacterium]